PILLVRRPPWLESVVVDRADGHQPVDGVGRRPVGPAAPIDHHDPPGIRMQRANLAEEVLAVVLLGAGQGAHHEGDGHARGSQPIERGQAGGTRALAADVVIGGVASIELADGAPTRAWIVFDHKKHRLLGQRTGHALPPPAMATTPSDGQHQGVYGQHAGAGKFTSCDSAVQTPWTSAIRPLISSYPRRLARRSGLAIFTATVSWSSTSPPRTTRLAVPRRRARSATATRCSPMPALR